VVISLTAGGTSLRAATVNVGTLSAGASAAVATTLTAPTSLGIYTVTATATTADPEGNTANNVTTTTLRVSGSPAGGGGCDYYAAPGGTGNGASVSSPFRIADFWEVAAPGKTLCLLDGIYRGADSMISPDAPSLSGTSTSPITVRALNDGAVTIDGEFARIPVRLSGNSWWVIEGINAKNGTTAVVAAVSGANDNIFRRIVGWDTDITTNSMIFVVNFSSRNVFEDVAGFGTARKIFQAFGNRAVDNVCRRCWLRWEGNLFFNSPKITATTTYGAYGTVFENVLTTWSGESMPETYYEWDGSRRVMPGQFRTRFSVPGASGLINRDEANFCTNIAVRGSLAYIPAQDNRGVPREPFGRSLVAQAQDHTTQTCVTFSHVASVIAPMHPAFGSMRAFALGAGGSSSLSSSNLTSVAGLSPIYSTAWTGSGYSHGTTIGSVPSPWAATTTGANLCYRWGTRAPLWPWPMNERIKAATAAAGAYNGPCGTPAYPCTGGRLPRLQTDVAAEIQALLGTIPGACRH
jgi:hypothetical protein